jgi:hypothetical protein
MAPARRRAGAIEIVALKCISVVNRLPQALGKLGLGDGGDKDGGDTDGDAPAAAAGGGGGADRRTCGGGGLRVAAAEELEPGEGEGWECAILRRADANGREAEVGTLLIQPLSTGLESETYLEWPAALLGADFGRRVERLLLRHRKPRRGRVKRANRLCEELAVPAAFRREAHATVVADLGAGGSDDPSRVREEITARWKAMPPADRAVWLSPPVVHHGTSQLPGHYVQQGRAHAASGRTAAAAASFESAATAASIVARAKARTCKILPPFKFQPCPDIGQPTVNLGPTISSLNAARYNTHSQHDWSRVMVGNFVEERQRALEGPELNFAPWGGEARAGASQCDNAEDLDQLAGAGAAAAGYPRGKRRPDEHDTRYLTANAIDVPLVAPADLTAGLAAAGTGTGTGTESLLGAEGYRLRRTAGWTQQQQQQPDPRATPAGAYRRPRAGGGGGPGDTTGAQEQGSPQWHGRVATFEAERMAQSDLTIVQHLQWPPPPPPPVSVAAGR